MMLTNILALESGAQRSSAALLLADGRISYGTTASGQSHSSSLLPLARGLLHEAGLRWQDLGGFVLGVGPGSFTGLRISCGLVQGLAKALGKPVLPVSSFEAWAYVLWKGQGMPAEFESEVCFDARLGEQFIARVRIDCKPAEGRPHAGGAPQFSWALAPAVRLGGGPTNDGSPDGSGRPMAAVLAEIGSTAAQLSQGGWMAPEQVVPLYVRERVAQTVSERAENPDLHWAPMSERDFASVMVIERQAYPFPWTSGNFKDSLKAGYEMWVLKEHGTMIGYMVWMRVLSEAHLLNFTLSPARQGHGLGSWMLQSLIGQARRAGLQKIILEVRPSNQRAIKLYQKFGFASIGLRKGYYPNHADSAPDQSFSQSREDALVMSYEVAHALA